MPVTQDRIIKIITAAIRFHEGLQRAAEEAELALARAEAAPDSALDEIRLLESLLKPSVLVGLDYSPAVAVVTNERDAMRRNFSRNEASRRWQERKRREAGIQPQQRRDPFNQPLYQTVTQQQEAVGLRPRQQQLLRPLQPAASAAPATEIFPEDTFVAGLDFSDEFQIETKISPEDKRIADIEGEIFTSPAGHVSNVKRPYSATHETITCQCGWEGPFSKWPNHWQGAKI